MEHMGIIIAVIFAVAMLQPIVQARFMAARRQQQIRKIERKRGSRVIVMIHRQDTRSLLGFPITRSIDLEDAQTIIPAIEATPAETPIDLILHTPGGMVLAAMQIARAVKSHPGKVTVHVPVYAMSGGTLIALAADSIRLGNFSVLGPIDPQISGIPAASLVEVESKKTVDEMSDLTLIFADIAEKALRQVKAGARELLEGTTDAEAANALADKLAGGYWTHDYALTAEEAAALGLPVEIGLDPEVLELMKLYPQPVRHTPSVEFLPHEPPKLPRRPVDRPGEAPS